MRTFKLLFLLTLVGCGSGAPETSTNPNPTSGPNNDGVGNGSNPDGGGGGGTKPVVTATHFEETGKDWFLPPNMSPASAWFVDANGDGWVDAFLTSAGSNRALGTSDSDAHWRFALNDKKSFAKSYTAFSVPSISLSSFQISGTEHRIAADFDGDHLLDLVTFQPGEPAEFRKGSASGFGAAQPWDAFPSEWSPRPPADLDGDKIIDFVVIKAGTTPSSGGAAEALMKVVRTKPGGGGFGPIETWAMPGLAAADVVNLDVRDFDGDGKADLVEIAEPAFRVWKNTGSGFAAPTTFTFPSACYCKTTKNGPSYVILDLDGDGLSDLIEPADMKAVDDKKSIYLQAWGVASAGGGGGKQYWKYYRNEGTGFAAEARQWGLPLRSGPGAAEGYHRVAKYVSYLKEWTTFDFNGDGIPDLVDTSDDALERKVIVYFGAP